MGCEKYAPTARSTTCQSRRRQRLKANMLAGYCHAAVRLFKRECLGRAQGGERGEARSPN